MTSTSEAPGAPGLADDEPGFGVVLGMAGTLALMAIFTLVLVRFRESLLAIVGFGVLLSPFFWLFISALRPALPERNCPGCSAESLVLIDPQDEIGVRCLDCDFEDTCLRVPYLKGVMNDPEIAALAGFVVDDYGQARLASKSSRA